MTGFLASEAALAAFLEDFENGMVSRAVWTHSAHVAMAACYCISYDESTALAKVRGSIRRLNQCLGNRNTEEDGYHETLTVFWLSVVRSFLTAHPPHSRPEAARSAVAEYGGSSGYFRRFYSFDVLNSREARARWIPPDLPG